MRKSLFGFVAAFLTLAAPLWADSLPASAIVQDLTYFRDVWAAKERAYSPEARAQLLAFVNARITEARPMERAELALVFAEAQALSGNNHTDSEYPFDEIFRVLPVSFWDFPEGFVVTRAHPAFRRLLGARIVSIGGVPAAEAARRVGKYISGTPQRKKYMAPAWLTRLEVLRAVSLAKGDMAAFELVLPSGARTTEELGASPTPDPAAGSPPWRASVVPGKGPDPWPHVLDVLPSVPPFAAPPDEMTSRMLDDGRILVVRSTSLSSYTNDPIVVQFKAYALMDAVVKSGKIPRDVVVDLRYNGGGNFLNVTNLAVELTKLVGPEGRVWVITGRATNSAAIAFTALLKANAPGRTKIVGEEPSDNPWFWSEGGGLEAPASKLPLKYTEGYHDWAHGCRELARCYWPAVFHGAAVGSVSPDLPIDQTFAEYTAGKDPAFDRILAAIRAARTLSLS